MKLPKPEPLFALVCIGAGLALALTIAGRGAFPLHNAIFYWLPQLLVFLALLPMRPRGAVFAGAALIIAAYCAAFTAWMFSRLHPEPSDWLGYLFTFPGAIVAALLAARWSNRHPAARPVIVLAIAFFFVLLGIFASQLLVCSTLMYCVGT